MELVPPVRRNRHGGHSGKTVTRQEVTELLKELQSAIIEQRIGKDSRYKSQVALIQKDLGAMLLTMGTSRQFAMTKNTYRVLREIIDLEFVRPAVPLLKKYFSFHGRPVRAIRKELLVLKNEFIEGLRTGLIKMRDPFYDDIRKQIIPSLVAFTEGRANKKGLFVAKNVTLQGLRPETEL
jgi:hypothetical protein